MNTDFNITLLVAPLDWGLGHAARCIPLVRHLLAIGCKVILAADGPQKQLLQIEFPQATILQLEGYNIKYSRDKRWFSLKIISQLPKIIKAIKKEHRWLIATVKKHNIDAIISDNRYGLWHPTLPVAFITHQLNIKTGLSWGEEFISNINYRFINRFSVCWVPDLQGSPNLAGELSHPNSLPSIPVKYLGGISRFEKQQSDEQYETLIVISGPEPQRTLLENRILQDLVHYYGTALMVRGLPGNELSIPPINNTTIVNHLPAHELSLAFERSKYIISRSGYTTVMDILKLDKKSILIPTPGQAEQEYLAHHLEKQKWCMTISQGDFSLETALQKAGKFPYQSTGLNMEMYKPILNEFVAQVALNKKHQIE